MNFYKVTIKSAWQVSPVYVVAPTWDAAVKKACALDLKDCHEDITNSGASSIELIGEAAMVLAT